ncbi:MAG: transcription factor S [Candidatus Freyarchaeota archaeon]|nr:transcription factor S [Candidatus Jordarchaeia archaeon]
MLDFCPKCGMLMYSEKKDGEIRLICRSCGHQEKPSVDHKEKFVVKKEIEHSPRDKTLILEDDQQLLKTMPTMKAVCPRCGNTTAYYWQIQTRRADEASTIFLRCTNCKHTWRVY